MLTMQYSFDLFSFSSTLLFKVVGLSIDVALSLHVMMLMVMVVMVIMMMMMVQLQCKNITGCPRPCNDNVWWWWRWCGGGGDDDDDDGGCGGVDNDDTSLFLTVLFLPVLSPSYRMMGFIISMQSLMALLLMGGAGVTTAVLRRYADIDLAVLASDLFNKVFNRQ